MTSVFIPLNKSIIAYSVYICLYRCSF